MNLQCSKKRVVSKPQGRSISKRNVQIPNWPSRAARDLTPTFMSGKSTSGLAGSPLALKLCALIRRLAVTVQWPDRFFLDAGPACG
jgi:hypothetical protein